MEKRTVKEAIVYVLIAVILMVTPVLSESMRSLSGEITAFNWSHIFRVWVYYIPFLVVFLIHNFWVAPLLIERKKKMLYFGTTLVLVAIFQVVQCAQKPDHLPHPRHHVGQTTTIDNPDGSVVAEQHGPDGQAPHDAHFNKHVPPPFIGEHDAVAFFVIIMLIGMNIGVKLYFKSERDHHVMEEMRRQNLEQQIAYLTYQINPHFFMNTLNNIHALVDIEPEKAKTTILELSKLMRFVLYDGNKSMVPLTKELDFLKNYIELMKLRYTDRVRIFVQLPNPVPETEVPPLLFITFVENAFKHGISYSKVSYVEIRVEVDDEQVRFTCRNTKADKPHGDKGGVGLSNIKQRLDLIYGNRYTLDIQDQDNTFNVTLVIRK